MFQKNFSIEFKIKILFFLFSLFLLSSYIIIDKLFFEEDSRNIAIENAFKKANEREVYFKNFLKQSSKTLFAIRNSSSFNSLLQNKNKNSTTLLEVFQTIAKSNTNFMQLRYLDKNGQEILRIDRTHEDENIIVIEKDKLQNKQNRYYFKDSKFKELGKVWFSALDLNIENGKVQIPFRPTLRAVLPIKYHDNFEGILIINYFMDDFLSKFTNLLFYDTVLLNNDGDTLLHFEKTKSWDFYKETKYNLSKELHIDVNNLISVPFYKGSNFVSKKFDIDLNDGLIIVLKLKKDYLAHQINKQNIQYLIVSLLVLVVAFISIYFVSKMLGGISSDLDKSQEFNKELQEVNSQLETILNTSKDGIAIFDLKTNFLFFNKSYLLTTGYTSEELSQISFFDLVKNADKNVLKRNIDKLNTHGYINNLEKTIMTKKGKEVVLLNSIVLMEDKKRILAISKDVTLVKAQENQIKAQEEVLIQQSKMVALGEMLENIAEQWKQPISVISTSASGLKMQKEYNLLTDEILFKGLDSILEYSEYLSTTIDDFRDFFKEDHEKLYFKISSVMKKCLFLVSSSFKMKNIEVIISKEDSEILSYKNELVQVIINILNNASDVLEIHENIEHKIVMIDILSNNENVTITIKDNAGGIPSNIIDKIFHQSFTTKGEELSTGIGLYMVEDIVKNKLDGIVTATNETFYYNDKKYLGACFSIILPRGNIE